MLLAVTLILVSSSVSVSVIGIVAVVALRYNIVVIIATIIAASGRLIVPSVANQKAWYLVQMLLIVKTKLH